MNTIKKALIPGSFDPVTAGHLAVIEAAAALFDEITVCILENPDKQPMFDEETRLAALKAAVAGLDNVTVTAFHGMTADYAKKIGAATIVRGIRNTEDMAYELPMADFNLRRAGIGTIWIPAPAEYRELSSSLIREMLHNGTVPDGLLPRGVAEILSGHAWL